MAAVAAPERAAATAPPIKLARGPRPFDDRATLESGIVSAWEGLVVEGRCACPVCEGEMRATGAAASCTNCASQLS